MRYKTTAEDGERAGSSDVRWKNVPQMNGCDRKCSVVDNRRVRHRMSSDVDEAIIWLVLQDI